MSNAAEFLLSIVDKMSGPADAIAGKLDLLSVVAQALTAPLAKVNGAIGGVGEAMAPISEMASTASAALGPLVGAASAVGSAMLSMAKMIVEASAVAVAAILAIVGAMAMLAIRASEARDRMAASLATLAGGASQGAATLDLVNRLADAFSLSSATVGGWTEKLLAAGVAGNKLQGAITAIAAANALIVGGGDKVAQLIAKLNEASEKGSKIKFSTSMLVGTGITESELMKALGMTPKQLEMAKKQGTITGQQLSDAIVKVLAGKQGALQEQASSVTGIWSRMTENVTRLFETVSKTEGYQSFVKAFKSVASIFMSTSPAAKAMQAGINGALSAVFALAAKTLPYVRLGIEKAIIAALKAYIAFKTWQKEGAHLGTLGAILNYVGSAASRAAGYIIGMTHAIVFLAKGALKAYAFGAALADGFAKGIRAGIANAVAAVSSLGGAAIAALKAALAIASPSRVFSQLGAHTAAGFQSGIQAGAAPVRAASARLASGAIAGAAGAQGAPGRPGAPGNNRDVGVRKNVTVNVMSGAITITGGGGGALELTEEALATLFERLALSQGVA